MSGNKLYTGIVSGVAVITLALTSCSSVPDEIVGVGTPKGYHIAKEHLPTKGVVDTIWFLSNNEYHITKLPNGNKVYEGDFKYHIQPSMSFAPNNPEHTDMKGHTPGSNPYWYDTRHGKVEVQKNIAHNSIDGKVNK